ILVPSNVKLSGAGDCTKIIFSNSSSLANGINIGTKNESALPTLSADISAGDYQVSFSGTIDLLPDDVFYVYDNTDKSYSDFRAYYKKGEFFKVKSVSGTVVTLFDPAYDDYLMGNANLIIRKVVLNKFNAIAHLKVEVAPGAQVNTLVNVQSAQN